MNEAINYYDQPHYVMLQIEMANSRVGTPKDLSFILAAHHNYYKKLKRSKTIIFYGKIMNEPGICILLRVTSQYEFENIITHDPAIKDNVFNVKKAMPFRAEVPFWNCNGKVNPSKERIL